MRNSSFLCLLGTLFVLPLTLPATSAHPSGGFVVQSINVRNGSRWELNRPLRVRFTEDVDFSTVNSNTIAIRQFGGGPAIGEYFLEDARTVVFQPRCPLEADLSDVGLEAGSFYGVRLTGIDTSAGPTVRSSSGAPLCTTVSGSFRTPSSSEPARLFLDTVTGPPSAVVRDQGSAESNATHVLIGGGKRLYFERAPNGVVTLENAAQLELNLLSNPSSRVAFMLALDQPVGPQADNITPDRLGWEYLDGAGVWQALTTEVSLVENCGGSGALVRIDPVGVLPPGTTLRAVVRPGFADLTGEATASVQNAFALARTMAPSPLADAVQEDFLETTFQDTEFQFAELPANWREGRLEANVGFSGTGGAGGDFDWEVKPGEVFVFDTTSSVLVGGPNFISAKQQVATGGVIDVRNVRIGVGARLVAQGPNPLTILATGKVEIYGSIEDSGVSNVGVTGLNMTSVPEKGASGNGGGGDGGTGSPLTTASSPRGGPGLGAFGVAGMGGEGGETSWIDSNNNKNARRGNGGGGGVFGHNQPAPPGVLGIWDQEFIGLDAELGFRNQFVGSGTLPKGAVSGQTPPVAAVTGASPFVDGDPGNDFFGRMFDATSGTITHGELAKPWAGQGGGGGGDASFTNGQPFPMSPFNPQGDEKGAGGGGGGGAVIIRAIGDIVFGVTGGIECRGGTGGGGENTNFLDRVGGGSGGGSGGHVILETASRIDFSQVASSSTAILATGGEGGTGRDNFGGATIGPNGSQEKPPSQDACPPGYPTFGPNACLGHVDGAGGDGGPGIVQMHTQGGLAGGDILLPPAKTLRDICKPEPVHTTPTERLLPSFGRVSRARSVWIPLGLGGFDASAMAAPFFKRSTWSFGDVDPATGFVQTAQGGVVNTQPPLLGPSALVAHPALPSIAPSGASLSMDATALIGTPAEVLLGNTALLLHAVLELSEIGNPANFLRYDVTAVRYHAGARRLELAVDSNGPTLASFAPAGGVQAALIPSFFRVSTDGTLDFLPSTSTVAIRFQATTANASGLPDESQAVPMPMMGNPAPLNASPLNPDFRFLRFEVSFDVGALGASTPVPSLEFLRVPFRH